MIPKRLDEETRRWIAAYVLAIAGAALLTVGAVFGLRFEAVRHFLANLAGV